MRARTAFHLAVSETRRARGTLAFCLLSVSIGVMALTAVRSVTDSLQGSIAGQARQILGADLRIDSNLPIDKGVAAELSAELGKRGGQGANLIEFYSMLASEGTTAGKSTQLVRVHAFGDGYPFYGAIATEPAGQWKKLGEAPQFLIDPGIARELGVKTGDMLRLGSLRAPIAGTFAKTPGSPAAEFSLAPILYLHERYLGETGLIQTGSRIQYQRLFALPDSFPVERWKDDNWDRAQDAHVQIRTWRESAANVQRFLARLSAFLTVVGLITLLLGALGIGSAMHAFMRGKLDHAAVLRCLGARSRDLFFIYSLLALFIAALGCVVGVLFGSLIPIALAGVARAIGSQFLPAELTIAPTLSAVLHGFSAGLIATFAFTLIPIIRTATVAPLRVLRREASPGIGSLGGALLLPSLGVFAAFVTVLLLSMVETGSIRIGLYFTAAIAGALLLLFALSRGVMALSRRVGPRLSRYHMRQGLANLHRPGNQTSSVIVAVGMGILLLGTILILQTSLKQTVAVDERDDLPQLFVIDLQQDQRAGVEEIFAKYRAEKVELAPMISARIRAVNDREVDRSKVERDAVQRTWEDRQRTREYFISYRDFLVPSESVTEGTFWTGRPARQEASIEEGMARNLGVDLGDKLTLDIQGLPLDAIVTSFREIRWQAMRPNAMILLSPGDIEKAPRMYVGSLRLPDANDRYPLQRELVARYPNLTVVDVSEAAQTVLLLLDKISAVFSILGLLAVVAGAVILAGAIAAGRRARERESMLLKVLGASRRDLRRILTTEYATLALFGTALGWGLAELLNRAAMPALFDAPTHVPYAMLGSVAALTVMLNVFVGMLVGRRVSSRPPLEILREE